MASPGQYSLGGGPRRVPSQVEEVGPPRSTWRTSGGFHPPFPRELRNTGHVCPEPRGGRIPDLETSTRSERSGLRPPQPPGPPPGVAASPGGASFCGSAPPSCPGTPGSPRSSHRISAAARHPPTRRADQTAPMAGRLRETAGAPDQGSAHPHGHTHPARLSLLRFHRGQPSPQWPRTSPAPPRPARQPRAH